MEKDKYIEQLETINQALTEKLSWLRKRQMRRNTDQSLKWRNKAFYYKKKCDFYSMFIEKRGLRLPAFTWARLMALRKGEKT